MFCSECKYQVEAKAVNENVVLEKSPVNMNSLIMKTLVENLCKKKKAEESVQCCSHPKHVGYDYVFGTAAYYPCSTFNNYEECKVGESINVTPDEPTPDNPEPPVEDTELPSQEGNENIPPEGFDDNQEPPEGSDGTTDDTQEQP